MTAKAVSQPCDLPWQKYADGKEMTYRSYKIRRKFIFEAYLEIRMIELGPPAPLDVPQDVDVDARGSHLGVVANDEGRKVQNNGAGDGTSDGAGVGADVQVGSDHQSEDLDDESVRVQDSNAVSPQDDSLDSEDFDFYRGRFSAARLRNAANAVPQDPVGPNYESEEPDNESEDPVGPDYESEDSDDKLLPGLISRIADNDDSDVEEDDADDEDDFNSDEEDNKCEDEDFVSYL